MKPLIVAGLVALIAAPSFAQNLTTLQFMLTKGVVVHAERNGRALDFHVTYKDDGTSMTTINGQELPGKWRVDGETFCTSNSANPTENCFPIPSEKKPGDAFKVMTPAFGETTVTINP